MTGVKQDLQDFADHEHQYLTEQQSSKVNAVNAADVHR